IANDKLGMTVQLSSRVPSTTTAATELSAKVLEAGERLERDALAGCVRNLGLALVLAELAPEHFDSERHRAVQAQLAAGGESDPDLVPLLAELDAVAAAEEIDEATTKELLLRLRERHLRRQLAADPDPSDLRDALARVREAAGSLV